ncbi:MAG: sugar phosphate isomerase/epimerase [Oscillospiraceae bacterium]|nr:sugar phosphate isomerase/epimerase [Oscillospiraceae bacterium]
MKAGIQLYSVKQHLMKDGLGTMREVAKVGYKYIEPFASERFGLGDGEKKYGLGMDRHAAKAFLDDTGIKIAGAHYYNMDDFEAMCDYFAFLGATQIGHGGMHYSSLDDLKEKTERMAAHSEIAKKYGLRYYYHNHFWEFQPFGGKTAWDIMVENTPADSFFFELDNYWACRGGASPITEAAKLGDRLILMHQKDFKKDCGEPLNLFEERIDIFDLDPELHQKNRHVGTFAEVGTGTLPIQAFINAGNKAGVEYILLEQDLCAIDEIDSIKISMDAFKKFKGIEWD